MANTIRNPLVWSAEALERALGGLSEAGARLGGAADGREAPPALRRIGMEDIRAALRAGWDDFLACRTHALLLCVIYPLVGLAAWMAAADARLLPLLFPAAAGFALIGPAAAIGLYELSRRRERGESPSWIDAFRVIGSPAFGPVFALTLMLGAVFVAWMAIAAALYAATLGAHAPASLADLARLALTTPEGWALIAASAAVGGLLAATVLAASVISFPMLLDRDVGLPAAVVASVRFTLLNPGPALAWGAIVAGALALGMLPLFAGLVVAVPVLGHATWHLYRRATAPEAEPGADKALA
ncbi:DUF2189 domain-containing protein [Oceanicella actignis]|uniref:Uncharacterized membrane protein n=1 Tax=Oceanicella actignis TaxID=1189325 RepID=A0A1M7TFF6_9RHOB|nr:DUF2189 domain-containing protein [Oceanicella actignis]SET61037.1 Uncharacterized membrane protein [Oceanicella actignis]SHN69484.1 Uncharacterized membrane protein [Oceanicella actignis]